ncbi:MAG: MGMT family protein [Bacteroidia bacterium]|nr:MGMT family protein [Bacteroidia bacterium]
MKEKPYFQQVYDVVLQIPYGRVTSYGAIADFLALGSARMVGYALKMSFYSDIPLPAHRVLNSSGVLSGAAAFGHPDRMKNLLQSENVSVKNNKVVAFEALFWNPSEELL